MGRARTRSTHAWASAAIALVAVTTACGPPAEPPAEPRLPDVDLTPALVLELTGDGLAARPGPAAGDDVRTDPPTLPGRSALNIRNASDRDQRLQAGAGGTTFDTGILRSGEDTTVVVANPSGAPVEQPLVEVIGDDQRGTLVIGPDAPPDRTGTTRAG